MSTSTDLDNRQHNSLNYSPSIGPLYRPAEGYVGVLARPSDLGGSSYIRHLVQYLNVKHLY